MTIGNVSMEKCWECFNPPKPEEEIPGSWVACIYYSKVLHLFKKQKKTDYTEIICVKHLTANKYYCCYSYITVILYKYILP